MKKFFMLTLAIVASLMSVDFSFGQGPEITDQERALLIEQVKKGLEATQQQVDLNTKDIVAIRTDIELKSKAIVALQTDVASVKGDIKAIYKWHDEVKEKMESMPNQVAESLKKQTEKTLVANTSSPSANPTPSLAGTGVGKLILRSQVGDIFLGYDPNQRLVDLKTGQLVNPNGKFLWLYENGVTTDASNFAGQNSGYAPQRQMPVQMQQQQFAAPMTTTTCQNGGCQNQGQQLSYSYMPY